jgi:hypothetical protein
VLKRRKISFVANATLNDGIRLKYFVPSVLTTFGSVLEELIVIVDHRQEDGRIKMHQNQNIINKLDQAAISNLIDDPKLKFIDLDYNRLDEISLKWFGRKGINKCQDGTPIFAFLFGIENCKLPYILRSDCDVLFRNKGFIQESFNLLPHYDLLQTPFMNDLAIPFSTRSFFINRDRVEKKLPMKVLQLDLLRSWHRRLLNRPPYMALEQMFEYNILKEHLNCFKFSTKTGLSMHIPFRRDFDDIEQVVTAFLADDIPTGQFSEQHNYKREYWDQTRIP